MDDFFSPNHSDRNDVTALYQSYPPHSLFHLLSTMPSKQVSSPALIRHLRNEKGTGAKTCPAIASGIVTGDVPISYWPFWFPRSLCER